MSKLYDGEFGSGDPIEEPRADQNAAPEDDGNLADYFLGFKSGPPAGSQQGSGEDAAPQGQRQGETTPAPGQDQGQTQPAATQDPNAQPQGQTAAQGQTASFQMPHELLSQYMRFLATQPPLPSQAMPANGVSVAGAVPGAVPGTPVGYPPPIAVQPYPGYAPVIPPQPAPIPAAAIPTVPSAAQAPTTQGQATDIDDTTWAERFYENPRKTLAQEIERRAAELATKIIEQRESQFGQVLGPMLQQMQARLQTLQTTLSEREWQDRMVSEMEALQAQDKDNFERVAPHMKEVLRQDPRLLMGLRSGQLSLAVIYALAAQRAGTMTQLAQAQADPQPQPDPKKAVRMPQSSGPRVLQDQADPDNETLVNAFLGPPERRGEFD